MSEKCQRRKSLALSRHALADRRVSLVDGMRWISSIGAVVPPVSSRRRCRASVIRVDDAMGGAARC
jgi:hypothetical protein